LRTICACYSTGATTTNASKTCTLDLDERSTWPDSVKAWTDERASLLRGTTTYWSSLRISDDDETDFRELIAVAGGKLLAYHSTRLLDHEVAAIRRDGLRVLSATLVATKIDDAFEHGYLTEPQRSQLHRSHVYAIGIAEGRDARVSLCLGREGFDAEPDGFEELLRTWGGEAIYWSSIESERIELLRRLGRPAIVVARVSPDHEHGRRTDLGRMFVGAALKLEDVSCDYFSLAPVPASDVLAIWQPGHKDYDDHAKLPH
jgi:hypothetical protein